ncbi:uncharacterized protein L203_103671 [Cryptococcus depauperatus CBS 7841]|uniref:Uncharacterized protein n=1 Tax=Cryptococcus depauperatus CBS 7841 TaxID=1295531 RepID=A0A1E3IF54_9TREE|nr:hypothetical protein L203_03829 [Cryptococcus depauperatus CBS 7841]
MADYPPSDHHFEITKSVLGLPLEARRELLTTLLSSLPRDDVLHLGDRIKVSCQKDIIGLLPPEISYLILARLDLKDLLNCTLVSQTWAGLCNQQALWAFLCSVHDPPIRPLPISWAELNAHRILPSPMEVIGDPSFDVSSSDEHMVNQIEIVGSSTATISSGTDPFGMTGGLRRNVWERRGVINRGMLPLQLQSSLSVSHEEVKEKDHPILSHIDVPSANPQANFKHLYIVHHILLKRMTECRPVGNIDPFYKASFERKPPEKRVRPLPRLRTIDAISSLRHGGLPGHSEAIYSLTLINHSMKITMSQNCSECNTQLNMSCGSFYDAERHFQQYTNITTLDSVLSSPHQHSQSGSTSKGVIYGRDWLLSGSRDMTLRLWQLSPNPRVVKIFHGGHTGSVLAHCIVEIPFSALSPLLMSQQTQIKCPLPSKNGEETMKIMAVSGGSDGKICLWDIEGGTEGPIRCVQAHDDSVLCVRAEGRRIVTCSKDKTIRLFDLPSFEELLVIGRTEGPSFHRGAVNAVALFKDYIISASGDRTLRLWSSHTGSLLACTSGHTRGIASIDFVPTALAPSMLSEGQSCKAMIVTGSSDACIKAFHVIECQPSLDGEDSASDYSMDLASGPSPSGSHDGLSQLQSPKSAVYLSEDGNRVILKETCSFWSPCVCPPGLARFSADGCMRCLNRGHLDLVRSVCFGKGVVLTGSYDATVKMWDVATGKIVADLSGGHTGRLFSVVGDRLRVISSGLDCRLNVWDFSEDLDTSFVES